jgi:hypothetical protein
MNLCLYWKGHFDKNDKSTESKSNNYSLSESIKFYKDKGNLNMI